MPPTDTSIECRVSGPSVALETTLLAHGLPAGEGASLARELSTIIESEGARPAVVGVLEGRPIVGMTDDELSRLLAADAVKANASNLGVCIHRRVTAATTVSATMELAAKSDVRIFATGGIGGVHPGFAQRPDISSDLGAFARWPVGVVTSGAKSLLDLIATREALETLGVPVVGYRTDLFPAFYMRESEATCDARFDDPDDLGAFIAAELSRTGRGVVICNPIPQEHAIDPDEWEAWLARAGSPAVSGRGVTPAILDRLHTISEGRTLRANIELVKANARLAGALAARLAGAG